MPEVGDVTFQDSGDIQHAGVICDYKGQCRLAHMIGDGPVISKHLPYGKTIVFRCSNQALARCAAHYALSWSFPMTSGELPSDDDVAANGTPLTPFTGPGSFTSRFYGMQAYRKSGKTAPFEHDALYRAFKWAGRLEGTASLKKGLTCGMFTCACFHAAAINLIYGGDLGKIQAKAKILGTGRSTQKALRADRRDLSKPLDKFENSVLRAWSNAGPLPGHDPDFQYHWKSVLNDGTKLPASLDEVFTAALLVDAKFTHGAQMKARMEADQAWWQKV